MGTLIEQFIFFPRSLLHDVWCKVECKLGLVLFTNMKSHMGCQLISKLMTLNNVMTTNAHCIHGS